MFNRKPLALLGGAIALSLICTQPALAQAVDRPGVSTSAGTGNSMGTVSGERVMSGRVGGDRNERQQNRRGASRPTRPPSPEQIIALAQAQATAAGLACQVREANAVGVSANQEAIFEAACATGPGYILIASTPPQSFDCIELAGTAAIARSRDPNADVGQQCVLPANQNALAVVGGYAREAGVTCTVDEGLPIGKSDANNMIYEVGCAGADGYWLERTATGWNVQDCLQIAAANGTCRFTTPAEQAAGFKPKLVGTEASACDVTQVRLMGQNANGRFYEAKCAAAGEGFVARVNAEGVTQQIYPCATAQRIGGGCTLTPAPAAAPAE